MPSPYGMDATPPVPPAVAGAMGGGPDSGDFGGIGKMMANKPAGASPAPGGAEPMGALKSAGDAVLKVIDNMAKMDPEGAPFAARIKQMLESWQAEAAKRGPGGRQMSAPPAGGPPGAPAKATEGHGSAGFVG